MTLSGFYPIFDHPDWLARALPLGVKLVQLRIKDRTQAETGALLRRGLELARAHGATLVVNDHWQTAIDAGAAWVHLGQEDLDTADIPAIRRAGIRLGISTHDRAELDRALSLAPDYIALGPVYPTILKPMKWHAQGLDRLRLWKSLIGPIPLCAIGGMTPQRAAGAFGSGADMVAAVTDITLHADPEVRIRDWLKVCA